MLEGSIKQIQIKNALLGGKEHGKNNERVKWKRTEMKSQITDTCPESSQRMFALFSQDFHTAATHNFIILVTTVNITNRGWVLLDIYLNLVGYIQLLAKYNSKKQSNQKRNRMFLSALILVSSDRHSNICLALHFCPIFQFKYIFSIV